MTRISFAHADDITSNEFSDVLRMVAFLMDYAKDSHYPSIIRNATFTACTLEALKVHTDLSRLAKLLQQVSFTTKTPRRSFKVFSSAIINENDCLVISFDDGFYLWVKSLNVKEEKNGGGDHPSYIPLYS